VDPDGNIYTFSATSGPNNDGRYSNPEVDRLLNAARAETDAAKRRDLYAQVLQIGIRQDRQRIYLWHRKNIVAHTARLSGFVPVADGLIRPQGLRLQ
jgi:peptide/nickel transport system substrate-binding protein